MASFQMSVEESQNATMMLHKGRFALVMSVMVLCGLLAACQPTPTLASSTGPGLVIGITDGTCPNVVIKVNELVTWTNQDDHEHFVRHKPEEGDPQFDSGTLQPGDSFTFTFLEVGTYRYECSADVSMTGTVTVQL